MPTCEAEREAQRSRAEANGNDPAGGIFKGVSSWFGGVNKESSAKRNGKLSPEDDPNTIHIFTIASGHMYERLQKIMVLSLIRNTRSSLACTCLGVTVD